MTLDDECRLSYYHSVAPVSEEHKVYLVQNTETGSFYVRKTLSVYNAEVIRQLKAHPVKGMPLIIEAVEDNGTMILIEEYIHGVTLENILHKCGPLPDDRAKEYFLQICAVVKRLHSMDPAIIHRDIKPSNIIITADGFAKLLDINATRFVSDSDRQDTVIMGTAGYAAPEQFGFTATDQKSDIYALGVLLNRMLTGDFPKNALAANKQLRSVVQKCTELDPKNRFNSIEEIERYFKTIDILDNRKQYLPPGFRNKSILKHLVSTLAYAALFDLCLTMNLKNSGPAESFIQKVFLLIISLMIIFFSGNYLGVQQYCPLTRSDNRLWHTLGVILSDALIFFIMLCILAIVIS